jgi:acetyltransferase
VNESTPAGRWPRVMRAPDGVVYRIRPIRKNDAQREQSFIMNLSAESRFQRFMYTISEPSEAFVAQLVDVDSHRNMAFVAITGEGDGETIIAVARYAADERGVDCEFAVAVADAWHTRGLGSTLGNLLIEHATREGFRTIYGSVLANNQRMIDLFDWLGFKLAPRERGQATVRASRRLN